MSSCVITSSKALEQKKYPEGKKKGLTEKKLFLYNALAFFTRSLAKQDDVIEAEGTVEECLPNAMFRVRLTQGPFPAGHEVLARVGGKLKKHSIRVITGDEVMVEISPYDLTKGRIVYRNSGSRSAAPAPAPAPEAATAPDASSPSADSSSS